LDKGENIMNMMCGNNIVGGIGTGKGSWCGIINLIIILIALEFLTCIFCGDCVTNGNNVCGTCF